MISFQRINTINTVKNKVKKISEILTKILPVSYSLLTAAIIMLSIMTLFYSIMVDLQGKECKYVTIKSFIHISTLDEAIGVGSLIFIIWTFSTGLIVMFLGAVNDKRYGIRIIDLVLAGECGFIKLLVLGVLFLFELGVLFAAILLEKEITLMICLILQIFWMVYFIILICTENSEQMIQNRVAKDTIRQMNKTGHAGALLYKMIRNLEYEDIVEIEKFFNLLNKIENNYRGDEVSKIRQQYSIQESSALLTDCMLKKIDDSRKAFGIAGSWLKLEGRYDRIKEGILKGILDNTYESFCPDLEEILDISFPEKRDILRWGIAYNCFYTDKKIGQGYRELLTVTMLEALDSPLDSNDLVEMFQMWREFADQKEQNDELVDMNLESLWKLTGRI